MTAFDNNVQQTRAALLKMARTLLHKQLGMNKYTASDHRLAGVTGVQCCHWSWQPLTFGVHDFLDSSYFKYTSENGK
jgi:hypothetical protein